MSYIEPWSKKHKKIAGSAVYSLSNSFVEPLTNEQLIELSLERGDQQIVDEFRHHSLAYTPSGGSLDLRQVIANFYGPDISADNIVVFPGGQVALQTAAAAVLDNKSHAIVFSPGYQSVQQAPVQATSQITTIQRRSVDHWQINPQWVEAAIQDNTRYIVINEPYNPAGTLMSAQLQQQLKDIAEKNGIFLLSDEVYRFLEHDANDRLPAMADLYAKGLSLCTLSKPWGGCGITIGWIALQDIELKQKLIDVQYFGTACPARSSEIQAIMTLRASDIILQEKMRIIHHNLTLLDQFIEDYSDLFEWVRPTAGAVAFVKFKGPLTSEQLGQQLAESGISIKPAYVFMANTKGYEHYFRIGYGEQNMPQALSALIHFVEENKDNWR